MAFRCYYKPETITRALVALRAELIREGGPGLEHVEALLQLRGHNLGPVPSKANSPARFRRNRLSRGGPPQRLRGDARSGARLRGPLRTETPHLAAPRASGGERADAYVTDT